MTRHYPELGSASDWLKQIFRQSDAKPRHGQCRVISVEFLPSFLRSHFTGTPVVASRYVVYFLRLLCQFYLNCSYNFGKIFQKEFTYQNSSLTKWTEKSYLKIVISFIFLPCISEIMSRSSAIILKAFFKGAYGRRFAFKDPIWLQCVREGILCQHFFHSHFNRPFARWRHFTTTFSREIYSERPYF